jgi:plastocyanin
MDKLFFRYHLNLLFLFQFWIIFISLAQDSQTPATGTIKGKITITSADDITGDIMRGRSLNRYGAMSMKSDKSAEPYGVSEKAVVYIESASGSYEPPHAHPKLDQRDMVFHPLVLPIVVGTTVDFPNSDPLFHNVFSFSQAKEFDLGRYPKGQKKSVIFDKTGVVSVYCEIHSYMFATILVLQNPYFVTPDDEGNYTLNGVPGGSYQLSFWYGRKKIRTEKITITPNQITTTNFSF